MLNPLAADLDYVLAHTESVWEELRGNRIFITGGTGFFGCWLLESFAWANDRLNLNASALVLTRSTSAFHQKAPHLANHPSIQFQLGDVRSFTFPEGKFSHVIHAATEVTSSLNKEHPLLQLDTIVQGTRHTLEFAKVCGAKKFLLTSSGAVYGKQPSDIQVILEDYCGAPDTMQPQSVYGEGKRLAELMCATYSSECGIETKIARCFAFVGPYLPIDEHFAIGNFIQDILKGVPICVNGDGTPYRSYMYAADLCIWLWTILAHGKSCQPYNVGSDTPITIADLAKTITGIVNPELPIKIVCSPAPDQSPERYVPSTQKAVDELNLPSKIDLEESIKLTIAWQKRLHLNLP